jgi:hypothetical protein
MKYIQIIICILISYTGVVKANSTNIEYENLANNYAQAWFKTQMSTATKSDVEYYLSFLTDDVAYQHLSYDKTDEKQEGGKAVLRKGTTQWLVSNIDYKAYINRHVIDSLEIDNNKISVIRKYC